MPPNPLTVTVRHLRRFVAGPDAPTDRELLERFATRRDEDAFATLVRRHAALVMGVCRRTLGHEQDAEDAFQATFYVLARKAGSGSWHDSVAGWLYQAARRLAGKARAAAARRAGRERTTAEPPEPPPAPGWPEVRLLLDDELGRLPDCYRLPLLLCYLDGRTRDEAARQLGWSLATLKRRLEGGRRRLRDRLARRGLDLTAGLLAALYPSCGVVEARAGELAHAAARFAAGDAANVAESAATLAREALGSTAADPPRLAALLVALGLAAGLAGLLLQRPGRDPVPPAPGGPDTGRAEPARLDRHGDPLPSGALARMGTSRFRHGASAVAAAFSPDGKMVVSGGFDRTLRLWDAASGAERRKCAGHTGGVIAVAYSPDGRTVITAGQDRSTRVWDVRPPNAAGIGPLAAFSFSGRRPWPEPICYSVGGLQHTTPAPTGSGWASGRARRPRRTAKASRIAGKALSGTTRFPEMTGQLLPSIRPA